MSASRSPPPPRHPPHPPDHDGERFPDGPTSNATMTGDKPSRSSHESGGRKSSKPLMEKRRRARINVCLTELQSILDALNPESGNSRQSKREKADILEQTVRLVKELRQRGNRGHPPDHHSQVQFRAGYNECMATVTQFLSANQSSLNVEAKADLMSHLANSLQSPNKPAVPDRGASLPQPRRLAEDSTNGGSPTIRVQHAQETPSQPETGNNSSMNVVHPMPAASAASTVLPLPARTVAAASVTAPAGAQVPAHSVALPVVPPRVESTHNGRAGMRLIPIGIPIKVQSAGQFVLLPSNGSQIATQIIPVISPPATALAPGPASSNSTGSSGSAAMSPQLEQHPQSPPKPSQTQNATATVSARPGAGAAVMYASYPAAALSARAETNGVAHAHAHHAAAAAPHPVAFVAMGEPGENGAVGGHFEQLLYPQVPGFYLPANGPNDSEPVWRPW